jgi:hypothetical protein
MTPSPSQPFDEPSRARCVGVTVRTPAGARSAFAVEPDDSAGQLTIRAIAHFERTGQLEPGSFRLGLLRGTTIVDLEIEANLRELVVEGDVLHLLTSEPQVDGSDDVNGHLDAHIAIATTNTIATTKGTGPFRSRSAAPHPHPGPGATGTLVRV